jgi:hypothetical protein
VLLSQQKQGTEKLPTCKLTIKDEVNIKVEGLSVETRRKIVNKLKYELPYARHMPAYKLGRWDGTKTFFGIGGGGYLAHLDVILPIIEDSGYEIDVEDLRRPQSKIEFTHIEENYWADKGKTWPKGHPEAGKPIVLRDYQYDVVNKFLENPRYIFYNLMKYWVLHNESKQFGSATNYIKMENITKYLLNYYITSKIYLVYLKKN